jgi:hypothetical protein
MFKLFAIFVFLLVAVNSKPAGLMTNPEEVAGEFEGDIILTESEISRMGRSGITDLWRRWPKNNFNKVIVPYTFRAGSPYCESILNDIN